MYRPRSTVGMVLSAVAEVASSADIAEVASSADLAEVASSADLAEVASSADIAGDVIFGVTFLADPGGVVIAGVAFREECEVQSGSVCDYDYYFYDGHYDDKPDDLDYDDPGDLDKYPSVYGFVGPDNYELHHDLHQPHDCGGMLCIPGWCRCGVLLEWI